MNFKLGFVAILAFFVLIFVVQNIDVVTVSFLFWEISMSRAILLFFSLLTGFIIGWLMHSYLSYSKDKREISDFKA
jgi:lipopolysaccharide assembly protein A